MCAKPIRQSIRLGFFFVLGMVGVTAPAFSAVVAHYRFEPGSFLSDSSGNGHDLTNTSNAAQIAIPDKFLNPIPPESGDANIAAAIVDALSTGSLFAPDDDAFTSTTLTVEALIRPDTLGGSTHVIVGHHDATINERGWFLGINNGRLRSFASGTGGSESQQTEDSLGPITVGNQYYVATSFSIGEGIGPNGQNVVGTMYLQNLTTGGPVFVHEFTSNAAVTTMNNVPGPLAIGSTSTQPDGASRFGGAIDEVRISNTVLGVEDLLVYHPGLQFVTPLSISAVLSNPTVDGTIESLTVTDGANMTTYRPQDFVGAKLTAFGGRIVNASSTIADIITPTGTTVGPAPADRDDLLADNLADTAFVNLSSWAVTFDQDIVNRVGPDIVLLDWGSPDTVDITINGITKDNVFPTSTNIFNASMGDRPRFQSVETDVNTLQKLIDATLAVTPVTSGNGTAFGIDLSDYGFAAGASLLAGTEVSFADGQGIDPAEIYGLLEPSTVLTGDFNEDGKVDAADYTVWRDGLGTVYDQSDYDDWKGNFGAMLGSGASTVAPVVPEPTALALLVLGCCFLPTRRYRSAR